MRSQKLYWLDGPEGQISQLWSTLRAEDARLEKQQTESFMAIQRALGRIEGKLNSRDEH